MKKQGFAVERAKSESDPVKITFTGDLSINTLEDMITPFSETLAANSSFKVLIKDVETIDLAFMQFVISAKKTAEQQNKKFELSFKVDSDTSSLLKNSGFDFLLSNNTAL